MKPKFILFAVCGIIAGLIIILLRPSLNKGGAVDCAGKGVVAPLFSLAGLGGEKINLADFKGKVIILDFWATWCPPCREGIPHLNRLSREYKKDGLMIIGISLDKGGAGEVQQFLAQKDVEYLNAMGTEEVFKAYSSLPGMGPIQGIPTAFVVDRQGRVCRKFVGLTSKEVFEAAIKPIL